MPNDPEIIRQYQAGINALGVYRRKDRGLLGLSGSDRCEWLNNLITNSVANMRPGQGRYAFATTVQGKTLFDLNCLALEDRLWLDIDRHLIEKAVEHLSRYLFTEDVALSDISTQSRRVTLLGPDADSVIDKLALGHVRPMAQLQHTACNVDDADVRMMRHDFAGVMGAEFIITGPAADTTAEVLASQVLEMGFPEVSDKVIEILRIEAGIPTPPDDINEDVIPPETDQIERGIDYHKGCYLGQEVIERMRSHGVLARRLVGIRIDGDGPISPGARIFAGDNDTCVSDPEDNDPKGSDIGRITSVCFSQALDSVLALGYVKTAQAHPDAPVTVITDEGSRSAAVVPLPVRNSAHES